MARRISSPEFVGRADELAALEAALGRAAGGEFAAVFVGGESGVGKSRLVRELERRTEGREARWLRGDCMLLAEGELPYAPITAALRSLVRGMDAGELDALLGPARPEFARLLPELGAAPEFDDPSASSLLEPLAQPRLFELLLSVLARIGGETPVVLTIEDLHWADRSTRDFLSFVIRSAQRERLLLVCTYRSDEIHRTHPLRRFLGEEGRRPAVERLELEPFSRSELAEQLAAILDHSPAPAVVDRLLERSEGNPFFAEELLAASSDAGGPLPGSVRDALAVRVDSLPEGSSDVLRFVTAAGGRVGHRLLATVAGLPDERLIEVLRDAVGHQVLVEAEDDSYAFRHALLHEVQYADLLPGERSALHLMLAEALEADPSLAVGAGMAAAAEIAHHWRAAHRLPDALRAWVRAGAESEQVGAFAEAARHFENALELWDRVAEAERDPALDKASLLGRAAEAASLTGSHARAVALGREAVAVVDQAGDPIRSALARERQGRYLWASSDGTAALESYREAVRMHPADSPTPGLARVLAAEAQILMLSGQLHEAKERAEGAIEIARGVGARASEGHALNTLGCILAASGAGEAGESHLRAALAIAQELGAHDDLCRAYTNLGDTIDQNGRLAEAVALTLEGAQIADRIGLRFYALGLEGWASDGLIRLGRLDEAADLLERGLRDDLTGVDALVILNSAGLLAVRTGDLDEATAYLDRLLPLLSQMRDSMSAGPVTGARAEAALWSGRPAEALRIVEESLDWYRGLDEIPFYTGRGYSVGLAAAAAMAEQASSLRDETALLEVRERARRLSERMASLAAPENFVERPQPEVVARELTCRAELSRVEGSSDPERWAAAAASWRDLGYPFERAYARMREAEALAAGDGDREAMREALLDAAAEARDLGAPHLLAEIEGLARRARVSLDEGEAPGAPSGADQFGLTVREIEVLLLLTEGRTNRQIGEALFMAEKTASVHVSHILAKLGVRSRVEAATAAHRLGLASPAARAETSGSRRDP